MPLSDYWNLFTDASISNPPDMDKYSRYLDAAVAQDSIKVDEIIGIGEVTGSLYVVTRQAIMSVYEAGIFKKRVEVRLVTPATSIAKLTTKDAHPSAESVKFSGQTDTIFSMTGWDLKGQVVLKIEWESGGAAQQIMRQREHLFNLIEEATGKTRRTQVGLKPLTPRGEYLVDLLADGNSYQFLGVSPDGVWMYRGEYAGALDRYKESLAVIEPQWMEHVTAKLYE